MMSGIETTMGTVNKVWTVEEIMGLLSRNREAVVRGLVAIYNKQTEDEKQAETTRHDNGIGFSGCDATILSSIAKQVLAGHRLSQKQYELVEKKMRKYVKQLTKIANRQI